jgi:hypothetical protein
VVGHTGCRDRPESQSQTLDQCAYVVTVNAERSKPRAGTDVDR